MQLHWGTQNHVVVYWPFLVDDGLFTASKKSHDEWLYTHDKGSQLNAFCFNSVSLFIPNIWCQYTLQLTIKFCTYLLFIYFTITFFFHLIDEFSIFDGYDWIFDDEFVIFNNKNCTFRRVFHLLQNSCHILLIANSALCSILYVTLAMYISFSNQVHWLSVKSRLFYYNDN